MGWLIFLRMSSLVSELIWVSSNNHSSSNPFTIHMGPGLIWAKAKAKAISLEYNVVIQLHIMSKDHFSVYSSCQSAKKRTSYLQQTSEVVLIHFLAGFSLKTWLSELSVQTLIRGPPRRTLVQFLFFQLNWFTWNIFSPILFLFRDQFAWFSDEWSVPASQIN